MSKRSKKPNASSRKQPPPQQVPIAIGGPPAWGAAILLALLIGLVYGRALHAPFIFDDRVGIAANESIFLLWPLVGPSSHPGPLNPRPNLPTSPRPLVNLSLAVNYFFGGLNPVGYHVVSVVIHFLTAMLLWAIVGRTLRLPYFDRRFDASAGWLALAVAMLWALHPLVTEAVIYATQRSELMMALFYLAILYCSLRYWWTLPLPPREGPGEGSLPLPPGESRSQGALNHSPSRRHRILWLTLAFVASLAGMASKEVMVSAPLMVLLFERTFIAGSLTKALRQSWPLYAGLASTWILLLVVSLRAPYGESAGFGLSIPASVWWLTQCKVFLMYLKLAIWPWPLFIHYELPYLNTLQQAWMYVVPVILLGIATLVLLWRNNPVGYLGTWIFAILSPTSVIPIVKEMAAERRMYLPLAAIVVLFVVGGYLLIQTVLRRQKASSQQLEYSNRSGVLAFLAAFLLAIVVGLVSAKRLAAYSDEKILWQEVLRFQPHNLKGHINLSMLLTNAGRSQEAIDVLQAALAIKPGQTPHEENSAYAPVFNNMGVALLYVGKLPEAVERFQQALRLKPNYAEAYCNLGIALANLGRGPEAIEALQAALELQPNYPLAHNNLGIALAQLGRRQQAIEHLERAVELQPKYADAHINLGTVLSQTGQIPRSIVHFQRALELNPKHAPAHYNYGNALAAAGRMDDAIYHFEQSIRLNPQFADTHNSLGKALSQIGRPQDAIEHFNEALRIKPATATYLNLAQALARLNRSDEALATAQKGIEVARSTGQKAAVETIEQWLQNYRGELQPKAAGRKEKAEQPVTPKTSVE